MKKKVKKMAKAQLSKVKFFLALNPKIERKNSDRDRYIPSPYKSVCLISADFEMAWASRYTKSSKDAYQKAIKDGLQTRKNLPKILDLCDKYGIPITWATVGHLFLESCKTIQGIKHPEIPRLPYFENNYWKFDKGDWFDYDPCTDYKTDPAWYAPDLIQEILSRKVKHEIGCHTFSHVDCRDSIDDGKVFDAEIAKCIELAARQGLKLQSFVHPGHTIGNLELLKKHGFSSFRTDYGDALANPVCHHEKLWELKNTAGLDWREGWSKSYHIHRYKTIIDRAIKHHKPCVLWFHPSFSKRFVDEVFPAVLAYLALRKRDIISLTHGDYVENLNQIFEQGALDDGNK